ncbi:MAG: O-antigen ligase family protein [Candidatus Portnoybacteria bacterium]|nr:O-antigen ligase family protein [Candidatus Portnoybacteria bacterium]
MKSETYLRDLNIRRKTKPDFFDISFFVLIFLLFFQFALNLSSDIDLVSGRVLIPVFFLFWLAGGFFFRWSLPSFFVSETLSFQGFGLLLFFIFALFSIMGAQEFLWGIRKLFFFASVFPLFFFASAFLRDKNRFQKVLKIIFGLGFLAALAGVMQFLAQFVFGPEVLSSFYLQKAGPFLWGNNFSLMVGQHPSWFVALAGGDIMRAFGSFPDPHMLSFFLGMILPLVVAGAMGSKKNQLLLFFLAGFIFLVLLATFSRGGYLGIVAAFVSMIFLGWRSFSGPVKVKIIMAGILIFFLIIALAQPVLERFFSSFFLSEGSSISRLEIWRNSWQVFISNPILGVGLGNYPRYADPLASYRTPITSHNLYLDLLVETGILGFFAWFLLLAGSFYQLLKFIRSRKSEHSSFLAIGLFGSLVYFFSHSLFESAVFNPVIISFFLIILALARNVKNHEYSA